MSESEFEEQEILRRIKELGIRQNKHLGQHFLFDRNILQKIAGSVSDIEHCCAIEVGPGPGTLTTNLVRKVQYLHVIEKDERFVCFLKETLGRRYSDRLNVIHADALRFDLKELKPEPEVMVSNLPYNIAARLILHYLANYAFLRRYVVTVQREVALRLASQPGSRDYGALTVKVQALSDVRLLFKIKPGAFVPPPKVESQVVYLERNLKIEEQQVQSFFDFVSSCFAYRRKTLANNLIKAGFCTSREEAVEFLESNGFDSDSRPEALGLKDYIRLYLAVSRRNG